MPHVCPTPPEGGVDYVALNAQLEAEAAATAGGAAFAAVPAPAVEL
jgi:hypothetical protein